MENLEKGVKVELVKQDSKVVIRFGAGWDENKGNSENFDVDLAAIIVDKDDKYVGMTYFGSPKNSQGKPSAYGITHSGDNLTGAGAGEDEFFKFDVENIDPRAAKVYTVLNVYAAKSRRQNFGQIKNCFIQATDETTNNVLAKFDLSEDFSGFTGLILGKTYRHNDAWKFEAMGKGVNGDLNEIAKECLSM